MTHCHQRSIWFQSILKNYINKTGINNLIENGQMEKMRVLREEERRRVIHPIKLCLPYWSLEKCSYNHNDTLFHTIQIGQNQKFSATSDGKDVRPWALSYTAERSVNEHNLYRRQSVLCNKNNTPALQEGSNSFPEHTSKQICQMFVPEYICIQRFRAALFMCTHIWRQSECPLTKE